MGVIACTVVAASLQLHAIAAKSLWFDEGTSIAIARLDWFNFLRLMWRREMNMVLYYLLLRGWLHFGDSVSFIRGLSVVFAAAAIPAIFVLGKKIASASVGLTAAVLLSVNAYQVRYAQEARSYSLVVFLVILSSYYFVTALKSEDGRDWKLYITCSSLAIYAHFFAVLVVVSHWISYRVFARTIPAANGLSSNENRRQVNRAVGLIALWTLPIWLFIATTGAGPIAWIPRPGLAALLFLTQNLAGNVHGPMLLIYVVCVTMGIIKAVAGVVQRRDISSCQVVLTCWLLAPILIVLAVSLARPVFEARYLIIVLPAWILLAALGINSLRPFIVSVLVLAGLLSIQMEGTLAYYRADFDLGRNDVRSAASYILERAQPGDAVLFYALGARFPYEYYARHSSATVMPEIVWPGTNSHLGWRDFMGSPSPARMPEFTDRHPRMWIVSASLPAEDAKLRTFQTALQSDYHLLSTQDFPFLHIYLFER